MSIASAQVELVTRADLEELRWLGRELLADHASGMALGEVEHGPFGDLRRLTDFAQALGSLAADLAIADRWWTADYLIGDFPVLEPMIDGASRLESHYRECIEQSPDTLIYEVLADRIASARGILRGIRREHRRRGLA